MFHSVCEFYLRTRLFIFRLQGVTIELCFEIHVKLCNMEHLVQAKNEILDFPNERD